MTIINGDITAFGHSDEWQTMKQEMRRLNTRVTFGLGNHDIENNYGETWDESSLGTFLSKYV